MIDTRDLTFSRVQVDFLQRGGARVSWSLFRQFLDPGPYSFQLQYSDTSTATADNWINCGAPGLNAGFAMDSIRRAAGIHQLGAYRVVLTTPLGIYTSKPATLTGMMAAHDWVSSREIVRQNRLRLGLAAGVRGWLFKRRWSGAIPDPYNPALAVTTPITSAITRPTAVATVGTQYMGGYFAPIAFTVELTPTAHREMQDTNLDTLDPPGVGVEGFVVAIPELRSDDIFVATGSDRRYRVHSVKNVAEWRGVPLLARVELRVIPTGDVAYSLTVPTDFDDVRITALPLAAAGGLPRPRWLRGV